MATQSNIHFFTNWAKERLDEMDAAVTSLEGKLAEVRSDSRDKADKVLAGLRKQRDDFKDTIRKQSEFNEAAWLLAKAKLELDWKVFEAELKKYVESFGKKAEHQQATFKVQADAQLKAWREAADKLGIDAKNFAAECRDEIDAVVKRMNADAAEAERKLQKLNQAGTQSWSALMAALAETRAALIKPIKQRSCLIEALIGFRDDALTDYLNGLPPALRSGFDGALAVAGPLSRDKVALTDLGWSFSTRDLHRSLGMGSLKVVNDFAATAIATRTCFRSGRELGRPPVRSGS